MKKKYIHISGKVNFPKDMYPVHKILKKKKKKKKKKIWRGHFLARLTHSAVVQVFYLNTLATCGLACSMAKR